MRSHCIFIPLLALLAITPLIVHGCSCGHDQPFHVQSWLDAAQQFRGGSLYPQWAYSPAWQAGEPRFIFYPPLSWILGALLTACLPMNVVPVAFTWTALTGAGFSMYHLARYFSSTNAALLCASVYMANPYMLFNAFERGAYAELLSAVWIPIVLLSVLRKRPSALGIATPLALVWLTNAPAGVMATYTLVLIGSFRLFQVVRENRTNPVSRVGMFPVLASITGGLIVGLALVSFYLFPAAYERRYVQVAMAIIPNLRYQDNFLFSKTDYVPHNQITFAVSVLALILLVITTVAALWSWRIIKRNSSGSSSHQPYAAMLLVALVIGLLLTPISAAIWEHLPNLKYLQFPWRLLAILSAVMAFCFAPIVDKIAAERRVTTWILAGFAVLALSHLGSHLYRQGCEANEYPASEAAAFRANHGVLPTDEYTPGDADNDVQRTDNPGYWLVQGDPNQPAPGTIANPNETIENYDGPIPFENTVATRAPHHLVLTLTASQTIVLNLRDYPGWRITRNGSALTSRAHRDDGLLAFPLPAGPSTLDITWRRSWDQFAGDAISVCALLLYAFLFARSRRIKA